MVGSTNFGGTISDKGQRRKKRRASFLSLFVAALLLVSPQGSHAAFIWYGKTAYEATAYQDGKLYYSIPGEWNAADAGEYYLGYKFYYFDSDSVKNVTCWYSDMRSSPSSLPKDTFICPTNVNNHAVVGITGGAMYQTAVTNVILRAPMRYVGFEAFMECAQLESVFLPDSMETIGMYAFEDCPVLSDINIPYGITSIGDFAFRECKALRWPGLPDSITELGKCAFDSCAAMDGVVVLSSSLIKLGSQAFHDCASIDAVTVPSGVADLNAGVFAGCSSLRWVALRSSTLSTADLSAFSLCTNLFAMFMNCNEPESVSNPTELPQQLTIYIPNSATWNCDVADDGKKTWPKGSANAVRVIAWGSAEMTELQGALTASVSKEVDRSVVTLSSTIEPSAIFYTTNGLSATWDDLPYTGSFPVPCDTPVNAVAIGTNGLYSVLDNIGESEVKVENLKAHQRHPWNGLVDLSFTVTGDASEKYDVSFVAKDVVGGTNLTMATLLDAKGASVSASGPISPGTYRWVWNAAADLPSGFVCNRVRVTGTVEEHKGLYMVIDLSGGSSASSYPVTYLDAVPSGGWTTDYKTTKLVLRKIDAGSYIMGTDQANTAHAITLSNPFYMGVFEVTQKQYSLVMGSDSTTGYGTGDSYPVYNVSYNNIRGSSDGTLWPFVSAVDSTSFLGKIRARTGIALDIPTEAQWEYACRAGTKTIYFTGWLIE